MKPAFLIYWNIYPAIKELSYEEKGKLFDAIFLYSLEKKIIKLNGMTKMAFNFIKQSLDNDTKRYEEVCEKNKKNIDTRWKKQGIRPYTTVYDGIRSYKKNTKHTNKNKNKNKKENINIIKGEYERDAKIILQRWNQVMGTALTSIEGFAANTVYWKKELGGLDKILELIDRVPEMQRKTTDSFWQNMTPTVLFRTKNKNGIANYFEALQTLGNKKLLFQPDEYEPAQNY